ncbi:MAG: hypothetical protein Q9169_002792 [Polycauliona sp. 2 TL-2023]
MLQSLPEGLVTTKVVQVKTGLESTDPVRVDDIARLWKVYHTNRAVLTEDVGRRLENFFWRIWGSHYLLHNITGTLVAAIFSKISEGGYIRTTPTQSPRSSRTLETSPRARQIDRPQTLHNALPRTSSSNGTSLPNDDGGGDAQETRTESRVAGNKRLPPRPPPILKKPKSISPPESLPVSDMIHRSSSANSTGGSSPAELAKNPVQAKSLERTGKTARFNSDEVTSSHFLPVVSDSDDRVDDETIEPQSKGKISANRRKAVVVTSTGASRRRPIMRQRSSQTSSSSALATAPVAMEVKPLTTSATVTDTNGRVGVPRVEEISEQKGSASERTSSSAALKLDRATRTSSRDELGRRTISTHTSFTSLPSILKGTPAAAASASYQATGMMEMGQCIGFGTNRGTIGHATPENRSSLNVQASEDSTKPLPRTKSQLTILLQRDRTAKGDH